MNSMRPAWIGLNLLPGMSPALAHRLIDACGSAEAVFLTPELAREKCRQLDIKHLVTIKEFDYQSAAKQEEDRCRALDCRIITWEDTEYPALLRGIATPPLVLYVRGELSLLAEKTLAVVGARKPTAYGRETTRQLVAAAVAQDWVIVSGMARGIDAEAHASAIRAEGITVAVLGHGLDQVYPPEHQALHDQIVQTGAVISEFALGIKPWPQNFLQRNRIISGLAKGVLVVEAGERSGTLNTAQWAGEQGREVFAVPGMIQSPLSRGTHQLIQQGAKLVTRIEDVFDEWKLSMPTVRSTQRERTVPLSEPPGLTPLQLAIYQALATESLHVDTLVQKCGVRVQELVVELLNMELQGFISSRPGHYYHRANPEMVQGHRMASN